MIEMVEIYDKYCEEKSIEKSLQNKKLPYKHRMSGCGSCFLKHIFAEMEAEGEFEDLPPSSSPVLRLGDIVHEDLQEAYLQRYSNDMVVKEYKVERKYERGHIDILHYNEDTITIIDFKTCNSWKWSKLFGHKKNREANSDFNYKMQIGSYGLAIKEAEPDKKIVLKLIYYNKDNSRIRTVIVDNSFIDKAELYWEDLKMIKDTFDISQIAPGIHFGVPAFEWECSTTYCRYGKHGICHSSLLDKKVAKK